MTRFYAVQQKVTHSVVVYQYRYPRPITVPTGVGLVAVAVLRGKQADAETAQFHRHCIRAGGEVVPSDLPEIECAHSALKFVGNPRGYRIFTVLHPGVPPPDRSTLRGANDFEIDVPVGERLGETAQGCHDRLQA